MMERADKAGLGIAVVGHAALFALLSLRLLTRPLPVPPPEQAIEVSLAPDVALQQSSPAPVPPAPSRAPEQGPPEAEAVPEPAPAPISKPAPKPVPAPKPAPTKPPPAAKPNPDRLASVVADAESAAAARADQAAAKAAAHAAWVEKVKAENAAKADAARATAEKAEATRVAAAAARAEAHATWVEKVKAANAAKAEAAQAARAAAARPRGSRLSNDFLKGLADTPAKTPPPSAAPGATMNAKAMADIGSAILRQVQPCADRQVIPGPGAERIRVSVNLKLNRDGSLAAPPRVVNHDGIDVDNRRYLDRVDDLAVATFVGCSPLRGLPAGLYDVPNGWRSFTLRFNLRG